MTLRGVYYCLVLETLLMLSVIFPLVIAVVVVFTLKFSVVTSGGVETLRPFLMMITLLLF